MFSYREADSQELKELIRQHERAALYAKCLEANIIRADYREFDTLMAKLEMARAEARSLAWKIMKLRYKEFQTELTANREV